MNTKAAMVHLAAYLEGRPAEPRLAKALKAIENDALLREKLAEQVAFDAGVGEMLGAITPPADLRHRLESVPPAGESKRPRESLTAMLSVIIGVVAMLGVVIFMQWESRQNFPGREALVRLVTSANNPRVGAEMEMVSNPAGQLGDWFYMRGVDFYQLPAELRQAPALGSRIFRQEGHLVAQIAIQPHESLIYVFKGEDFGVQLPSAEGWSFLEAEGWAAAARKHENTHLMITFKGTEAEMRDFVKTLPAP